MLRRLDLKDPWRSLDASFWPDDLLLGRHTVIYGHNGSGKSTLLGILARVYRPLSGEVVVRGRVAPLLELGAGFHEDLTGLENISLHGSILGMTRAREELTISYLHGLPEALKPMLEFCDHLV